MNAFRADLLPAPAGRSTALGAGYRVPQQVLRRWLAPFVVVAIVAQASAVALPGTRSAVLFAASCAVLALAIALALLLGRMGGRSWTALAAPLTYLVALALLLRSQTAGDSGLQPLVLLPIAWAALYHRPRESAVLVLGAVGMLVGLAAAAHAPVPVIVRRGGLWTLAGTIVIFGMHNLRRWLTEATGEREEALRQARILGEVARELNSTLDPEQVIAIAVRLAAEIASPPGLRARRANYCRVSGGVVQVTAEFDGEGEWVGASWPLGDHPLLARAVETRRPTVGTLDPLMLGPEVRRLAGDQGVRDGAWVPVVVGGQLHGVVAVAGRNRAVSEQELSRCVAIVRTMELALTNALAHQHVRRAALTDPLTSLANRRGMHRLVRAHRGRRPLAVLTIDIDRLKQVNDRHGHAAGDELLALVAEVLGSVLRTGDVLARVGGDEFAAVVFGADEDAGARVAERMLESVLAARHLDRAPSISIGVACAEPAVPLDDALRRADAAMYEAKRAGGMRYRRASSPPAPKPAARPAAA